MTHVRCSKVAVLVLGIVVSACGDSSAPNSDLGADMNFQFRDTAVPDTTVDGPVADTSVDTSSDVGPDVAQPDQGSDVGDAGSDDSATDAALSDASADGAAADGALADASADMLPDAGPCTPLVSNAIALLRANGDGLDSIGTNHGTPQGNVTYGLGQFGLAFEFDGSSYMDMAMDPALAGTGSWTYTLWIRVDSYSNGGGGNGSGSYFLDRQSATNRLVSLKAVGDNFYFQKRYNNGNGLGGPSGGVISPGTWTHIAMVRDFAAAKFRLYVNGVQVDSSNDNGNTLTPPAPRIGRQFSSSGFTGAIDELAIYSRALDSTEIQSLFSSTTGSCN